MDWNAIREEYIKDESTSYRKLAKKYGVVRCTLEKKAKDEKWVEQRRLLKGKTTAKSLEKISEAKAREAAKRVDLYNGMVDKLGTKIAAAIESLNPEDATAVRRLTASLLEFKSLIGVKSDDDKREQEARIKKLESDAGVGSGEDEEGKAYGVLVMPAIPEKLTPPENNNE